MSSAAVARGERNDTAWAAALGEHARAHGFAVAPRRPPASGPRLSAACNRYTAGRVIFFTWDHDGGRYREISSSDALRILADAIRTRDA